MIRPSKQGWTANVHLLRLEEVLLVTCVVMLQHLSCVVWTSSRFRQQLWHRFVKHALLLFFASTRSGRFIFVLTSFIIQVDSSVGGKTGVNHPLGKNLIGAFFQPQCVLIDTNTLNTLPDRELASGIAEVIKYGLIRDSQFFEWQEQNMEALLARYETSSSNVF